MFALMGRLSEAWLKRPQGRSDGVLQQDEFRKAFPDFDGRYQIQLSIKRHNPREPASVPAA
jgi:hypothetical protein